MRIFLIIALLSSGCASMSPQQEAFVACSAFDTGTTAYGLTQLGMDELNPVLKDLKNWQVIAAGILAGVVVYYSFEKLDKDWLWWAGAGVECGAGAWNLKEIMEADGR